MTLLLFIAFMLIVIGTFVILNLSPFTFLEYLGTFIKPKRTTLKSKIKAAKKQKQPKGFKLLILEVKEILILTGKINKLKAIYVLSMILFLVGTMISLSINNIYLLPVLAIGFALIPFYYIIFTSSKYKRVLNNELETTLSIITISYTRGNNTFINAVEENVQFLNEPMSNLFEEFLLNANQLNVPLKQALEKLKLGLDNVIFYEWVDTVIACQDDYNLKYTLPVIIHKLADIRMVTIKLDSILFEPVKEYVMMIGLLIGNIPLIYFLNKDWYDILINTDFGNILLAISIAVLVFSISIVAKHVKPIEYKR